MSSPVLHGNKKHHCINQAPNVRYKRRRVVSPAVEKAVCEATSLDIISKSDIGPLMHHEAARNVAKQKPQELNDKSAISLFCRKSCVAEQPEQKVKEQTFGSERHDNVSSFQS
jgi:hypothetical protein